MLNKETNNREQKKDRVLGDEWKGWDGNQEGLNGVIDEKKRTFFVFSFFVILIIIGASLLFLYLIIPRLDLISPTLKFTVVGSFTFGILILLFWHISLILAVSGKKVLSFSRGFNKKLLIFIINNTAKLGAKFGISKDRMANSFLKVLNLVTEKDVRYLLPLKPLIVLPRCLTKEIKAKADELSKKYGVDHFIVGGGQAALSILKKKRPQAVIGVACERDLISAIKEVKVDIPVFSISNRRPHGPCKDTDIDVLELERAIRYFMQV